METLAKLCWLVLAAIHLAPATVLVDPGLTLKLYGVPPDGAAGVLLIHRGALFLAVVAVALLAVFSPEARRAASLVVGISVIGFLAVYTAQGLPAGPLRIIALVDAAALLPLAACIWLAWRGPVPA